MLVFLDEAGDTGLKFEKGSSELFVVTIVIFDTDEDAFAADERIIALRQELCLKKDFEFHFSETHPSLRKEFFKAVSSCEFTYYGIVIRKALLQGDDFRNKHYFYVSELL